MDKVKKWDEINGSGTSEEKMEAFLTDANDTYAILQLRYSDETAHERFESLKGLKRQGIEPTIDHYEVIYVAPLLPYKDRDVMLESLYATFNVDHPEDFRGHSMSVSDVVAFKFVSSIGTPVNEFNAVVSTSSKIAVQPTIAILGIMVIKPNKKPAICLMNSSNHAKILIETLY